MCLNCAFSLEDKPNQCTECDICIRNPRNVSIKFLAIKYKDTLIEKPIDMYISRELLDIIRREIKKMYEEGLRRGQIPTKDFYPIAWTPYPGRWWDSQSLFKVKYPGRIFSSSSTLTITYTVSVGTCLPLTPQEIKPEQLGFSSQLGEINELKQPQQKKVVKSVCIDIQEVLEALDEVEVGDAF